MITCQHARQLFDRHLDDELSPSLQAELHAHVIQCTPCQNQLALFEACGDVIRLDAREPRVSGSFADRVMAGRRQQLVTAAARRPAAGRRMIWRIGVPMTAAAGVVLALALGAFMYGQVSGGHKTVVGGLSVAAPVEVQKNLMNLTGRTLNPESAKELANTPEMKSLQFLEALVTPLVEGAQNAAAGTRQSYEDIEALVRLAFAGQTERLAAEYREEHPELSPQDAYRVITDLEILPEALQPITDQPAANASPSNAKAAPDAL
jgi:hypothetical protein